MHSLLHQHYARQAAAQRERTARAIGEHRAKAPPGSWRIRAARGLVALAARLDSESSRRQPA